MTVLSVTAAVALQSFSGFRLGSEALLAKEMQALQNCGHYDLHGHVHLQAENAKRCSVQAKERCTLFDNHTSSQCTTSKRGNLTSFACRAAADVEQ